MRHRAEGGGGGEADEGSGGAHGGSARTTSSGSIPIPDADSVALLHVLDLRRLRLLRELHERGHDRRGRRRAAVHAVGRLPAARHARARGRACGCSSAPAAACGSPTPRSCSSATPRRCSSARRWRRPSWPRPRGRSPGRARIAAFQSVALRLALPAMRRARARGAAAALRAARGRAGAGAARARARRRRPRARRRVAAPAAAAARRASSATTCSSDPVRLVLPAGHPAARRHRDAVPLAELAGEAWATGHAGAGLGRDDPPHLPRARRLRARCAPPHQRRRRSASRSSPAAWRSTLLPDLPLPAPAAGPRRARRSPRAR